MNNIFLMRLFRCFVLTMTGTLFWFFSEKSFLKIIIAVLIVFLLAYYGKEIDIITQNKKIFFVVTIFLALISAFFVFRLHNTKYENELHDSKVDLRMVVVRPSVVSGEHNITLGRIVNEGSFRDKYILIRSDLFESYEINQILFANAKIQRHKNKSVPFDLLFFGKVFYQIGFEKIEVVGKNKQFNIFEKMATWRKMLDDRIKIIFSLENYNLIAMWLFGKTKVIDYDLKESFQKTGISHILVISGAHLSIIFNLAMYCLIFLPFMGGIISFVFLAALLAIFLLLAGFSASLFRASLMWGLILLARSKGLLINYTNVLLIVLLLLAVTNPLVLVYDVGFHLSFLSVASLFYILPIIGFWYKKLDISLPGWLAVLVEIFLVSLSVSIGLFAYLILVFKEFNFLSMFFNVFLMPLAGISLGLVFLAVLVSFLGIFFGQVLGFLSMIVIGVFLWGVGLFGQMNARFNILMFNVPAVTFFYYLMVFILVVDFYKNNKNLTLNI